MRLVAALLVLAATRAGALKVGETYDQVLAEKGFPQNELQAGSRRILTYPDALIKLDGDAVISFQLVAQASPTPHPTASPGARASSADQPPDRGPVPDEVIDARNRLDAVLAEVRRIVNQPATAYPMTDDLRAKVTVYPAGWFQPGADVPGFATVDIQATQILTYAQDEWVTSNLTPGVAFRGEDLEFNSMTKFFYTDRSLPKRKLTQAEMRRVNALYRQIATYSSELQRFGHPWTPSPGSPAP